MGVVLQGAWAGLVVCRVSYSLKSCQFEVVRAPDALRLPPLGETTTTSDWSLREDQEFAHWDYISHLVREHVKMDQWEKGRSVACYHHNMKRQDGCFFANAKFLFGQLCPLARRNNWNKCHNPGSCDTLCFFSGREARSALSLSSSCCLSAILHIILSLFLTSGLVICIHRQLWR